MREPVTLTWAGGREDAFLLHSTGEMIALEKACGAGVGRIMSRLMATLTGSAEFYVADITETLRLGLIGGGMTRDEAARAVKQAADWHGLLSLAPVALSVLSSSLGSADDDEDETEDEAEDKKKATSTGELTSAPSTKAAP